MVNLKSIRRRMNRKDSLDMPLSKPLLPKIEEVEKVDGDFDAWYERKFLRTHKIQTFLEWLVLAVAVVLLTLIYYYPNEFHFHVAKGYAHLGYDIAQHQMGLKHYHGVGVAEDKREAMKWFKAAADQGHHEAAMHRGIGNIHGFTDPKDITPGETERYLKHAADNDHHQAKQALYHYCHKQNKCP